MTTWASAHALAFTAARPLGPVPLPLPAATGLVAAAGTVAARPSPAFDAAAMDGYAVAGPGPWRVTASVLAGRSGRAAITPGEAVEIATGAVVPAGTTAVVPYERCSRTGDLVTAAAPARDHIRRAGEDVAPGELVLPAGRTVTAVAAAALAQAGVAEVLVHPRPRVATLVTGDEVVLTGPLGPGQVRDAFSGVVAALAARAGAEALPPRHVPDDPAALSAALAAAGAEVVAVTGASSRGAADHLHRVLGALRAQWLVDGVACRPGHPQGLAALPDGRWVVSLPGNPYAGLVAALTLLEPLLRRLSGRDAGSVDTRAVDGEARPFPGGVRIVPVVLTDGRASIVPGARPGGLRAAARADALAVLPPQWQSGTPARLLALP
ncbi:molybdopterin molybdotransferase MoeA [Dactylosporangium sp. CA-233914]|uniref:molybdopterin molybdotransferase MoeA n=1 Tax=Dactylosporangium sp. CA-233914 TaxID=3239934 RepID=UPI003D8D79A5